MDKVTNYLSEVKSELERVEWPKREDAMKLTLTVVIITVVVGSFVGGIDYIFARSVEYLLKL